MIVIAIIAILASILTPNFIRARSRSQLVGCSSNLRSIATALEICAYDAEGFYPPAIADLTPTYLKTLPECPVAGTDTYSGSYTTAIPADFFYYCEGTFHSGFAPTDYPQYDAGDGLIER